MGLRRARPMVGMPSGEDTGQTLAMSVESESAIVAATSRMREGLFVQKKFSCVRELCDEAGRAEEGEG